MTPKRVAVFIPCYNAAGTITETIVSVQKAIAFTSREIPVFVYDDCSTDNSIEVAKNAWTGSGEFHVIRNKENSGERKTTNLAFTEQKDRFDWICILHADDIAKQDWLSILIEKIEQTAFDRCFTVWSSFDSFNDSDRKILEGDNSGTVDSLKRSEKDIKYFLVKVYGSWHISGAAINLPLFMSLNGFDERMPQFGDTDFFVRGLLKGYLDVYIRRTLTLYRILDGSVSSVSLKTNRDISEIHMLMAKFEQILNKKEIAIMYKIIRRLSARRTVKHLIRGNIHGAFLNFTELFNTFKN